MSKAINTLATVALVTLSVWFIAWAGVKTLDGLDSSRGEYWQEQGK